MVDSQNTFTGLIFGSLTTLGIIWGDIGTSPLYTVSSVYGCDDVCEEPLFDDLRGSLSCIIWSLTFIAFLKYILIVLRFDYHGEGGIFALYLNIVRGTKRRLPLSLKKLLQLLAIIGSSALIADSVLTPALSVLSAVEGIRDSRDLSTSQKDTVNSLVVPITIVILLILFSLQRFGTTKVGQYFGPIMVVYFISILAIGLYNIIAADQWGMFAALSPTYAIEFFTSGRYQGFESFKKLSSIVLCVTGAEAVYSDVGHTGKPPIYVSWILLVFPALIINYAGQAAYLVDNPGDIGSAFWSSVPNSIYIPMLVVATLATVVASQAMITGCYTLISSATALNLFMKVRVINTDPTKNGQVYIPEVNITLCVLTIALVAGFKKSVALAGAYGISVVLTFNITTILLGVALYWVKWPKTHWVWVALAVTPFAVVDLAFLASNLAFKFVQGGFITLLIAAVLTCIMLVWSYGRSAKIRARKTKSDSGSTFEGLAKGIAEGTIKRCPGIGIYLSPMRLKEPGCRHIALSSMIAVPETPGQLVSASGENIERFESYMPTTEQSKTEWDFSDGEAYATHATSVLPSTTAEVVRSSGSGSFVRSRDSQVSNPIPPSLLFYLKLTGSIQRVAVILHVHFNQDKPKLTINQRVTIDEIVTVGSVGIYSATVSFGFAEPLSEVDMDKIVHQWIVEEIPKHGDIQDLFQPKVLDGENLDDKLWYLVHLEEHECKPDSNMFRQAVIWLYAALHNVSRSPHVFLNLPPDEVVQLGDIVTI